MRVQLSADASQEAKGFEPLPEGYYFVTVKKVTDGTAKSGRPMALLELEVNDGPWKNRKLWHNVTFIAKGEKGHGFTVQVLKAFGLQFDGDLDFDTQDFRGQTAQAHVGVEEWTAEGKTGKRNVIVDFVTGQPVVTATKAKETEEAPF